jgi:L-fucose isomerase-like protein
MVNDNAVKPKVGIITFTDGRDSFFDLPRETYLHQRHAELAQFLGDNGCTVIDPLPSLRPDPNDWFGVRRYNDAAYCARYLQSHGAECMILCSHFWTPPMLVIDVVREANLPTMLYTVDDPTMPGTVSISAVGASLLESGVNQHALQHERLRGQPERMLPWIRGVSAVARMRQGAVMLWGGTYALHMEHLQDDIPALKRLMIRDILNEGEYALIRRAEKILAQEPERVQHFLDWLKANGATIIYDDISATPRNFQVQIAYYLAARDRLKELESENIIGVSVRCQPTLSVEYGIVGCTLPAFLPFGADDLGPKPIISTVCEGDIKGLMTSLLLQQIRPDVGPIFGDLKYVGADFFSISNCGAASVWWAGKSNDPAKSLPNVTIRANVDGFTGAAVGFLGQAGPVTTARLGRVKGRYVMHLGVGESVAVTGAVKEKVMGFFGQMWPNVMIKLGTEPDLLFRVATSNHPVATDGDVAQEVTYACRQMGIPIVRLDSNDSMREYLDSLAALN